MEPDADDHDTTETTRADDETVSAIAAMTRYVIDQLTPIAPMPFGLDAESVRWFDAYVDRQRRFPGFDPSRIGHLVEPFGCYLGDAIAAATEGHWVLRGTWRGVEVAEEVISFPFHKVEKLLEEGLEGGECLMALYESSIWYHNDRRSSPSGPTDPA